MKPPEPKSIGSYLKGYKMYLKDGMVVVAGNGKFSNYTALFYLSDVRELVKE